MEPAAPSSLIGAVLDGRYRVIDSIAEGAMGVVYRAERVKLGRIVAIKVLHDELPHELASRKRFEIEAMAMAKLEHPHCAAVLDVGVHDEKPFVVMDFVSGQNLKELIAQGPVPPARAVEIVRQTLSGLAHAHEHGIIHRDIKPANIVLSQKAGLGDHVKILDFGLARLNADASNLTTGIVVGTPSYMAPEQIRGVVIDKRVDFYACGILLFELVTGQKPFFSQKDDPLEVCAMHLKTPPPTLSSMLPGVELGDLEAVVAKALAKTPDARYSTAEEMSAALTTALRKPTPSAPALAQPLLARPPSDANVSSEPIPIPDVTPVPQPAPTPSPASLSLPQQAATAGRPLPLRKLAIAGGGVLALIVIIAIAARGGTSNDRPVTAPADARKPEPISVQGDPVDDVLSRANELVSNGRREGALDLLTAARRTYPSDARLAYLVGKLYFSKLWYTDGLKHLRDAVKLDPHLKNDPELIKTVLKAFNTTPRYDSALATFLHDQIGEAAKPFLEETASAHTNAQIRARAEAELRRY